MKEKLIVLFKTLTRSILKLAYLIPSPVPVGMSEFDAWSKSIIDVYGFPDNDSIRFALATMIMHSGPTSANVSKHYFSLCVKASMAKQIAGGQFQAMKQRQIEAQKLAEATAPPVVAPDVQPIQN